MQGGFRQREDITALGQYSHVRYYYYFSNTIFFV